MTFDPDTMPSWLASLWPKASLPNAIIAGIAEDDCAIIKVGSKFLVISTDFLNAKPIAFELGIGSLWDLGRLVVAANLSDLCGTGADPKALLVGVCLPYSSSESEFKQFMRGVQFESRRWSVPVIGGDSKLGPSRAVYAVGIGEADRRRNLFPKNKAKVGDKVWASGNLGTAAAAVIAQKKSKNPLTWAKHALIKPNLPLQKSRQISRLEVGHAGTDISDGLGADLHSLCDASEVGVVIDSSKIPVATSTKRVARDCDVPPWTFAFTCGGDFQFIVTASPKSSPKMEELKMIEIGQIVRNERKIITLNGETALPQTGHRDKNKMSFHEEIIHLINALK